MQERRERREGKGQLKGWREQIGKESLYKSDTLHFTRSLILILKRLGLTHIRFTALSNCWVLRKKKSPSSLWSEPRSVSPPSPPWFNKVQWSFFSHCLAGSEAVGQLLEPHSSWYAAGWATHFFDPFFSTLSSLPSTRSCLFNQDITWRSGL